ncbi:hypothetical protein VPH35_002152 [Triticum aestivum]
MQYTSTASATSQVVVLPIPSPPFPLLRTHRLRRAGRPIHLYGRRRHRCMSIHADHGRHHPRQRPRLLRHAPHRDLLQGKGGGEAVSMASWSASTMAGSSMARASASRSHRLMEQ